MSENQYKVAPTWLHKEGESRLFTTQDEVDRAWDNGWSGPVRGEIRPLLSSVIFATKKEMIRAVYKDERYEEMELNEKESITILKDSIVLFENEMEL